MDQHGPVAVANWKRGERWGAGGAPQGGAARAHFSGVMPWLWGLRFSVGALLWLAVLGICLVEGAPAVGMPLIGLFVLVLMSNLGILLARRRRGMMSRWALGMTLAFDVLVLAAMLYLTGGAANPLTFFFVLPVLLSAFILGRLWTWPIALLCTCCYALLFRFYQPMGEEQALSAAERFARHQVGMFLAFIGVAGIIGLFVSKLVALKRADENRLMQSQARADRFAALAALAGGAAHELATPLGTIAVVARELERAVERGTVEPEEVRGDAQLIRQQVDRCRGILEQLHPSTQGADLEAFDAEPVLREVVAGFPPGRVQRTGGASGQVWAPRALFRMALEALLNNARDASDETRLVTLEVRPEKRAAGQPASVTFVVSDHGGGMPPEVLARAGEPFFTTKAPGQGMGLGLFVVYLLADRAGGQFVLESSPGTGTRASLTLPVAGPAPAG